MAQLFITPDDRLQKIFDTALPGTVIHLSAGVYRQKAVIRTPGLTVIGAGAERSRIVFDDYARKRESDGFELITFRSFSLAVCADGVTLKDLSVINDAGDPKEKGQQVALSVVADGFRMENCRLSSTQDTLFCGPLPDDLIERYEGFLPEELRRGGKMQQVFQNCRIEGTVDFIFGCGDARFENCEIRSLSDGRDIGYIAAPAHEKRQNHGFRFQRCVMTDGGAGEQSVYLARPWRDHGLCLFEQCTYGPHIKTEGFHHWDGTQRWRTARFYELPAVDGRVPWVKPAGEDESQ